MPTNTPQTEATSTTLTDTLQTLQNVLAEIDTKRNHLKQLQHDVDELTPVLRGLTAFEEITRREISLDEEKLTQYKILQSTDSENTRKKTRSLEANMHQNQRFLKHLAEQIPALETRVKTLVEEITKIESEIQALITQRDQSIKHLKTFTQPPTITIAAAETEHL